MRTINQHSPAGVAEMGRKRMEFLYQSRNKKLAYLPCLVKKKNETHSECCNVATKSLRKN